MKILIVDDSPTALAKYGQLLKRAGYEVLMASGPEGALPMARSALPDLALVDYHLATSSGDELIMDLTRDSTTRSTLVLMLSADENALPIALEAGAIDLLVKGEPDALFLSRIACYARIVSTYKKQINQLVSMFFKTTEALDVGVILQDNSGQRLFNPIMESFARQCSSEMDVTCGPDNPHLETMLLNAEQFKVKRVDLKGGEHLSLVTKSA